MLERFTEEARRVAVLSRDEAARLHQDSVGTEHILLGLLRDPDGIPCRVLGSFGLSLESCREEVAAISSPAGTGPDRPIPFTRQASKALGEAAREAAALRHDYIGPEHILLSVIRIDGAGARILDQHAGSAAVRSAVLDLMPAGTEDTRRFYWLRVRAGMNPADLGAVEQVLHATPAADAALAEAVRLAGSARAGSHHLLLAVLADESTAAASALIALGVDLGQAREALRRADVTGTSDEQPEDTGCREMTGLESGDLTEIEEVDSASGKATRDALRAIEDIAGPPPTRAHPQ
jgi:ATP-dependent Clp protease ATP-binding subunit ClpA